jgi:Spy/CpxP family protein refolding chaperone
MKKNIVTFIVIAATLLGAGTLSAQSKKENSEKNKGSKGKVEQAEKGGKGIAGSDEMKELGLTADQGKKIQAIHQKYKGQMDALKEDKDKTALKNLREKKQAEIKAVLTPEQAQKWQAMKEEKEGERMAEHQDELKEKLGLTDDQAAKIQALHAKYKSQKDALKADATKTEEQKKEAMKAIHKSKQEEMKAILSPEQLQKFEAMKKEHGPK